MGTRRIRPAAAIRVLSTAFFVLVAASCGPRQRAPAHAPAHAFDADAVDVTVDWQAAKDPRDRAASLALTASDGSGLELQSIEARSVLYGPLAFTELHLLFHNPEPRAREGVFSIVLPDGAALSRFAMRQEGGFQEGEVVPREQARAVYEDFVHRKVDPAVLEHDSGNVFRGRVFPIGPRSDKEIVVAYTEELASAEQPYRLPLRGLGVVGRVDVQLLVPNLKKAFVLHREAWAPDRDFVYAPPPGTADAVRGGRYLVTRSQRKAGRGDPEEIDSLAVLVDSSASRAPTYAADLERVAKVVGALGAKSVSYTCFDQEIAAAPSLEAAAKRKPSGASNLGAALRALRTSGAKRALLVTDGIASAGPFRAQDLAAEVASLRAAGIERVDAVAVGSKRDATLLATLVTAGLASDGAVVGTDELEKAAAILRRRAGGRAELVFSEADPRRVSGAVVDAPSELVERAFAQATIRRLTAERSAPGISASASEAKKTEIVELAMRHRLLTEFTSMLVLETEADYARFKLVHSARRNVLIAGSRGVEVQPEDAPVLVPPRYRSSSSAPSPARGPERGSTLPRQDTDRDGIPDELDKCPNEPETFNGIEDDDGCPDVGRIIIENQSIRIIPRIQFSGSGARIPPEATPILDEIAAVMKAHTNIDLVAVSGHTDATGSAEANQRLSEARARAVRDALIARGVSPKRLVAQGFGDTRPLSDNRSPEGREQNRRVEFTILAANGRSNDNAITPAEARRMAAARVSRTPLEGPSATIDKLLSDKQPSEALRAAEAWRARAPDDVLAAIAEGRSLEALGRYAEAARAYGSVLDLATRPELRRAGAAWLEALAAKHPPALEIAIDAYRRAAAERPEQPSSHRLLAWALARADRTDEALGTVLEALGRSYDSRFPNVVDVFRGDAEVLGAALARGKPEAARTQIEAQIKASGAALLATQPSTRIVLTWETDESDLDLLAIEPRKIPRAPIANARRGYGPELVTTPATSSTLPLQLEIDLVERGPSGDVIGKIAIVHHDGRGALTFDDRPFVMMNQGATLKLGTVLAPK